MKISFYSDSHWDGGGKLPRHLEDFSDLAAWIRAFLAEVKDLSDSFLVAVKADGRILGQEKANLVNEIDEIVGGILLFRRYLTPGGPERINVSEIGGPVFSVEFVDSTWSGNGRLPFAGRTEYMSFSELHNNLVLEKIRDLFVSYGKDMADGILSGDEQKGLLEKTDSLFCDLLRIERRLLHSAISE